MRFFLCPNCDHWCWAPKGFRITDHIVKCPCGYAMLITEGRPEQCQITLHRQVEGELRTNEEGV